MNPRTKKLIPILAAAALLAATAAEAARGGKKRSGGDAGSATCAEYSMDAQPSADLSSVEVSASFRNTCFPERDLDARMELWIDGALVAAAELGPDDSAQLHAVVPRPDEPGLHEIVIRVEGSVTELVRRKLRTSDYSAEQGGMLIF